MPFYIYPPEFYYREKSDEAAYSFIPQGELDVRRLINNQAPWKKTGAIETKNKVVVLSSLFPLNQIDSYSIESIIHKLQSEGFVVYLHRDC